MTKTERSFMAPLSRFCPRTGRLHGDALSCGSCLATVSRIPEVEVIDLVDSSPPAPSRAISVFALPSPKPRFSQYNCTAGAEQLRQAAISRTKKVNSGSALSAVQINVHFWLLKQKRKNEVFIPFSCTPVCMFKVLSLKKSNLIDLCSPDYSQDLSPYDYLL
jgi:hypothetical protein